MRFDEDLHERLGDLADSGGPWDDPLPVVLDRARAERRTASSRRRRRWHETPGLRRMLAVAATLAIIGGAGAGLWQLGSGGGSSAKSSSAPGSGKRDAAGSSAAGGVEARPHRPAHDAPPSCGSVPVSSGPAAGTATLSVRLLRSATGAVTGVRPQLHNPAGLPVIAATGSTRVVVVAGAHVVASWVSAPAVGNQEQPSAGLRAAPLPTTACSQPGAATPLPAGRYAVIVAVGYRTAVDATAGVIVSVPVAITVR